MSTMYKASNVLWAMAILFGLLVIAIPGFHSASAYETCAIMAAAIGVGALVRLHRQGLLSATPRQLIVAFSSDSRAKSPTLEKLAFIVCWAAYFSQYF